MTPAEWSLIIGAISAAVGGVAAAIVAIVKASADAAKVRAEVEAMRADMARARTLDAQRRTENDQLLRETHHQVTPNNGGSIIDATGRLESTMATLTAGLERVENAHRDTAADVRGIRRDIGRINDDNREHSRHADREHERIHERIDGLIARVTPFRRATPKTPPPERTTP